jgi:long-chain acyl-CoA synthetase
MGINVGQILRQAARSHPDRPALLDVGAPGSTARELSFAELHERAATLAAVLTAHGLGAGDCVAVVGENSAELVAGWFGCVYAGAAVVPLNVLSAPAELRFRIEHAGCRALLFDGPRARLAADAVAGMTEPPISIALEDAVRERRAPLPYVADTQPDDTAMVLYTSGTTGKPKGAAISHASLVVHTSVLVRHGLALAPEDSVLSVLPITHSYGCRTALLVGFFAGARVVLVPRFDAARTLALMHDERVSYVPAVPTMYAAWGALPDGPSPPALRFGLSAGAPLADEVARRAEKRLGAEVRQGYGLTEATFCTLNAPPDARVLGSVGKPLWGVEVRVVDAAGQDVAPGADGEVVVRGHNAMTRYLHDPEATAQVSTGGFLHTGDVGRFDGEGRLAIVDRIKDLIIRGGYNVYPSEVEDALSLHPEIEAVAVVGVPDAYYGEEVAAVVVRRPGSALDEAALLAWAKEQLGRTKLPRTVRFVEALPLGPSGKVQKRELRDWLKGDVREPA